MNKAIFAFIIVYLVFVNSHLALAEITPLPSLEANKSELSEGGVKLLDLQRAAQAGDIPSQFSLGVMYKNGDGVAQDYSRAFFGFRRLLKQEMLLRN